MSELRTLSQSAIFEGIAPSVVEQLCSKGRQVSTDSGHRLFDRDGNASELMILQEGAVDLVFPLQVMSVTREVAMDRLQPGDVVAWSSLVHPYRFTLGAQCATRCVLTVLPRATLEEFFGSDPLTGHLFMRNLAGVIGRRLQKMQMMWVHDLQTSAAKHMS